MSDCVQCVVRMDECGNNNHLLFLLRWSHHLSLVWNHLCLLLTVHAGLFLWCVALFRISRPPHMTLLLWITHSYNQCCHLHRCVWGWTPVTPLWRSRRTVKRSRDVTSSSSHVCVKSGNCLFELVFFLDKLVSHSNTSKENKAFTVWTPVICNNGADPEVGNTFAEFCVLYSEGQCWQTQLKVMKDRTGSGGLGGG